MEPIVQGILSCYISDAFPTLAGLRSQNSPLIVVQKERTQKHIHIIITFLFMGYMLKYTICDRETQTNHNFFSYKYIYPLAS